MSCPQLWGLERDLHVLPGVLSGSHQFGICRQSMSPPTLTTLSLPNKATLRQFWSAVLPLLQELPVQER